MPVVGLLVRAPAVPVVWVDWLWHAGTVQPAELAAGEGRWLTEGRYKFHYLDTAPLRAVVERWPIKERGTQ